MRSGWVRAFGSGFRKYRILWVAYGLAVLMGTREYLMSKEGGRAPLPGSCEASAASCSLSASRVSVTADEFWRQHAELAAVVEEINPDAVDTHFLKGMQALVDGDEETFVREFEAALASGAKHNQYLLHYYAQYMVDRAEDHDAVNRALNGWRSNHPFSSETITLRLGVGPRHAGEVEAVRRALVDIEWIGDARLELAGEGGAEHWRARLGFRPGRTIDIRDAIAAVTVLALPPEHRSTHRVECMTMQDCRAVPRR